MIKNFVIFKSPYLRYRKEDFGGIAKLRLKTFLLSRKQISLIERMRKVLIYGNLNEIERKIADKLIENEILLKVSLERAKQLGFKKSI